MLDVRLARFSAITSARELGSSGSPGANDGFDWSVTLRTVSEKHLILTVDSVGGMGVQEVRTVAAGREPEETAWTIGLVVEEAIVPFLENNGEMPALGAGLAIIEPEVIGGTRQKADGEKRRAYPRLKGIGLELTLSGIWSINEILVGPHLSLKGIFSARAMASFGIGWAGSADFSRDNIDGSMSRIPIELLFGYLMVDSRHFELAGWTGFSLGFAVYRTQDEDTSRTDMTFQPGFDIYGELVVKIVSPWAVSLRGGCNFPFVRDVLVNRGMEVYKHEWVVPVIALGTQLIF